MKTVAVLGGGITGLAAAEALVRLGHSVTVFERSTALGGFIRTELANGWLVESGPNSFQEGSDSARGAIERLGLSQERLEASPSAKNRYVVKNGRLVALPLSPPGLLVSPLFSWSAKAKIVGELFRKPLKRTQEVSVAQFVREHFGQEVLDYAVQPFVSGIYAGDPESLSVSHAFPSLAAFEKSHGSVLRSQMALAKEKRKNGRPSLAPIISFKRGLSSLTEAYQAKLPAGSVVLGAEVTAIAYSSRWEVTTKTAHGFEAQSFDAVISALPAGALAQLAIGGDSQRPLSLLSEITHPPIASLFLGYKRNQVSHPLDGFGALVPAVEKRSLLGAIFSSTLFAGRAPEGHVAITALAGGALAPRFALMEPAALLSALTPDLKALLGIEGAPVFMRHTLWRKSIPQYSLGYQRFQDAIVAVENTNPGFFVGGVVRDGISVPACIASGERLARLAAG